MKWREIDSCSHGRFLHRHHLKTFIRRRPLETGTTTAADAEVEVLVYVFDTYEGVVGHMTPHLSLWYSHNVRIYFVKFDAESHLVYWPMIFDFWGGWTTKYKEIKITFMSNNIMWCLFWNPAVGWIGVFCGPDPAYGPPVDDHCSRVFLLSGYLCGVYFSVTRPEPRCFVPVGFLARRARPCCFLFMCCAL